MKYLKSLGLFISSFLTSNVIITLLSYFELLNTNIIKILKLFVILSSCLISGIYLGIKSNKKGYLEGLKLGGIIISIFVLLTLIIKPITFSIFTWLYYLIIPGLIIISSMIGINIKKSKS